MRSILWPWFAQTQEKLSPWERRLHMSIFYLFQSCMFFMILRANWTSSFCLFVLFFWRWYMSFMTQKPWQLRRLLWRCSKLPFIEHWKLILTALILVVLILYAHLCSLCLPLQCMFPSFFCSCNLCSDCYWTERGLREHGAEFYRCQNWSWRGTTWLRGNLIKVVQQCVAKWRGSLLIVPCGFM